VAGEQVVEQATHDLSPFLDILKGTPDFCSSAINMSRTVGSSSAYSIRFPPTRVLVLPSRCVRPPPPSDRMNHFPSPPQVAARYRAGSPPVLKCWWNQPSGGTKRLPSVQSMRTCVGASEYIMAPFHISVNPWPFSITTCDPGPWRCAFLYVPTSNSEMCACMVLSAICSSMRELPSPRSLLAKSPSVRAFATKLLSQV